MSAESLTSPTPTWDQRILAQVPSGLDLTQLDENLALSPTERVRKMARFLRLAEELKDARSRGLRSDPDRTR
jgi:hypothetical protein